MEFKGCKIVSCISSESFMGNCKHECLILNSKSRHMKLEIHSDNDGSSVWEFSV